MLKQPAEKQIRLNAPTYMRPRRPVLDNPLDIDAGKANKLPQISEELIGVEVVEPVLTETAVPSVVEEEAAAVEAVEEMAVAATDVVQKGTTPVEPVVETPSAPETVNEPSSEAVEDEKPRHKGMSVFQQVIVLLLLLVVAAVLATIYLYTHGWIELPPAVFELIDKGLALIQ